MRRVRSLLAVALVSGCATLTLARPARACWDGYRASTAHVELTGGDDVWSVARARELGTWLVRLEALARDGGASLLLEGDYLSIAPRAGTERDLGRRDWTPSRVFEALARAVRASPAARRAALRERATVLTVEVASGLDAAVAARLVERLRERELGEHGFYEAGGFPADNPTAHVLGGRGANGGRASVVVGAFLDRRAAERVAATLAREPGLRPRVRPL